MLLRGDVERCGRRADRVEVTGVHGREQRGALDELVAGHRVEPALRCAAAGVVRPTDALEERGDRARGADLAHQLDRSDVDAELQGCGGDQCLQLPGAQARLDAVAPVLREAAVVRGDDVVAEPLAEQVREAFGETARVDEHERRAVLGDELRDPVEDVGHLLGGRDGFELTVGQLEREVEVALVPAVDDRREVAITDEQARDRLDGTLRRGQPDTRRALLAERFEPFEGEGEVRAALVVCDGVDLVDDDRLRGAHEVAAALARDEQVQRLGRRHDERRRSAQHRRALRRRRVAGADRDGEVGRVAVRARPRRWRSR